MKKILKPIALILLVGALAALGATLLHGHTIAVLQPKGEIARKELALMITALLLMLVVVIPVFALTIGIAWRYRASNTKAKYSPELDGNKAAELTWWAVPTAIIVVLAGITWVSAHALDPYKPIVSTVKPLTIEVVALDWKWLFIYPEQDIASVNVVHFPKQTPINFVITSDAPMNSFWIPQLGGQIYAMPGMSTNLHLMADGVGSYAGSSANISGAGFAGMTFTAVATSNADFNDWVSTVQGNPSNLTQSVYNTLARPSQNNKQAFYSSPDPGLYDGIIMKYMTPSPSAQPEGIQ